MPATQRPQPSFLAFVEPTGLAAAKNFDKAQNIYPSCASEGLLSAAETFHPRPGKGPAAHTRARLKLSAHRLRGRSNWDQAASAPDALATWVAIASIKAGERKS